MERWLAKVLALIVLFVIILTATLLPIKVTTFFERHGARGRRIISYFMCFGGGVFLATFALHMGPDVRLIFYHTIQEPYGIQYPVADLVILGGLFLMLFLEKCLEKTKKPKDRPQSTEVKEMKPINNGQDTTANGYTAVSTVVYVEQQHEAHELDVQDVKSLRSLLLLLALSLDHIFEGISVGLKHSITSAWNLTAAILAHEVVIAFSLGMRLVKAYSSLRKIVTLAVICSIMEPIGVAIGMVLMETGSHSENPTVMLVNGILQALCTGVFMYATFFEILSDELSDNTSITRLFFMLLGFAVLALMGMIPENEEIIDMADSAINITSTVQTWTNVTG